MEVTSVCPSWEQVPIETYEQSLQELFLNNTYEQGKFNSILCYFVIFNKN